MDFWYRIFSGLGFIFILNNYFVLNIKNSLGDHIMENGNYNSKIFWRAYKIYAVGRRKTIKAISYIKNSINNKTLTKNILLIKDGERKEIINVSNNSPHKYLPKDITAYDLIIYRVPSKKTDCDYDLVRLSLPFQDNKENTNNNHNCYDGKIYSPMVKILSNENVENSYDLELDSDNYYVEGNKIYDTPFIKWIVKEKYKEALVENDYEITYLDEDMNECSINNKDYLVVSSDGIKKVIYQDGVDSEKNGSSSSNTGWGIW